MKKIAVVILNWNGKSLLEKFLPSVVQYSQVANIYVADNASADESISFLETHYPNVTILRNNQNFGFAGGYNKALTSISEPYLCLLNSDVEVTPDWLSPILEIFENEPETAIIQPKIKDYKNKPFFEYAGAAGGFIDKYGYPFCRGRIFDTLEEDLGQYDTRVDIDWASGACFFIRNSVFKGLDGFDIDFFAHQEEIDLCWRAKNKGYRITFCPQSEVFHVGGATLNESNPKKTLLNFRNSLFMLVKNLPTSHLFSVVFIRLILDGIAGIQLMVKGKFWHTFSIIQSHFQFYGQLNRMRKKRSTSQNKQYYHVTSIVYLYFIKGKKRFLEI